MKQKQSSRLFSFLRFPFMHRSIQYRNNSLYALYPIPAQTILFHTSSSQILSISNLPQQIRNLQGLSQSNLLTLSILLLKCLPKSQNEQLAKWIGAKTSGFVDFSQDVIRASNDQQLQIQYSACRHHYKQEAAKIWKNSGVRQILHDQNIQINQKQFTYLWKQASQFINTRCFGFTKDSLIIPGMDWLNYDPSRNSNKLAFITYDTQSQIKECIQNIKKQSSAQNSITKSHVAIITLEDIVKDQQLLFNYGNVCNYDLLRFYGYSVRNNYNDYLQVYVSNFCRKDKMIFYSQVQRATTGFQLNKHEINEQFIDFWRRLCKSEASPFNQVNQNKAIHFVRELFDQLSGCRPPKMLQQQISKYENQSGFQYLQIYQQQQLLIYQNQLSMLKLYIEKNYN